MTSLGAQVGRPLSYENLSNIVAIVDFFASLAMFLCHLA